MTFLIISGGHDYADPVYMNDDDDIDNDDDGAYGITHKEIEITTRFKILTHKNLALKFVASIYFSIVDIKIMALSDIFHIIALINLA